MQRTAISAAVVCQWANALGATVIGTVGSGQRRRNSHVRMAAIIPSSARAQDFVAAGSHADHRRCKGAGGLRRRRRDTLMKSLDCLAGAV